jgi:hypothetical protein
MTPPAPAVLTAAELPDRIFERLALLLKSARAGAS